MIIKLKLYSNIMRIVKLLSQLEVRLTHFILPVCLALAAALFEGLSLAILIPTIKGIIKMDFGFVGAVPVLGKIIAKFSQVFIISNTTIFILLLSMIALATIAKNILQYLSAVGMSYQVRYFSSQLRKSIFNRYLSFGKRYFDLQSTGSLSQVLMGFTNAIAGRLMSLEASLVSIAMLITYLVIMLVISWKLTIFVIFIFPLVAYFSRWLIETIKKGSIAWAEAYTSLSRGIFNILSCMSLVKAYTMEEKEKRQFARANEAIKKIEVDIDKKHYLIPLVHEIITLVMLLLFIAAIAFLVVKKQSGNVAAFAVYIIIVRRIFAYAKGLNRFRVSLAHMEGAARSILKVFEDKGKFFVSDGKEKFKRLEKNIQFSHLKFSYKKENPILKDISFSVERGKMTAIVGPTGAGKTTLINLILRFYDCPPASIFIDGVDIREFTLESLRKRMALVSQDVLLFNDTLRNNITYGLERECGDEELGEIVKKAKLYDFISQLPQGLDTVVGDKGVKLSGGERQRVSIARALLRGTEILILDEATSSLDTHTERLVQAAIEQVIKGRTSIIIAHRLSTIKNSDKVIVIEEGRFIEEGTLNQLLRRKGMFYQYWQEQKFY